MKNTIPTEPLVLYIEKGHIEKIELASTASSHHSPPTVNALTNSQLVLGFYYVLLSCGIER